MHDTKRFYASPNWELELSQSGSPVIGPGLFSAPILCLHDGSHDLQVVLPEMCSASLYCARGFYVVPIPFGRMLLHVRRKTRGRTQG